MAKPRRVSPRKGVPLSATDRARIYHNNAIGRIRKELKLLEELPDKGLPEKLRERELQALVTREEEELVVVEAALKRNLPFDDVSRAKAQLAKLQREDRRKAISDLIAANPVQGIAQLKALLIPQGFVAADQTIQRDLQELNVVRYKPTPTSKLQYALLAPDDRATNEQLVEFALSNAAGFSLQNIVRKGDRLYLDCTHRTAGHLSDALAERMVPDVVSIMSDNYSTVWIEMADEVAARQLETLLRKYMIFGS